MKHLSSATAFVVLLLASPALASSIAGGGSGGGGSGTVTTTGTPSSGKLTKFSGATSITNGDISGDCTTSGTLAITCTKTNGSSFGTAATANMGTSGATLPVNNGANVESGSWTFNAGLVFGNQTAPFGTSGVGHQGTWTHTDTSTGAGIVATNYEHVFGTVTDATPSNAITITNDYGVLFASPASGANITITHPYAAGFSGPTNLFGNLSNADWSTTDGNGGGWGPGFEIADRTLTNTTATGTNSFLGVNVIGAPTINSTNAGVTYRRVANLWVKAPVAGTNTTFGVPVAAHFDGDIEMLSGHVIWGASVNGNQSGTSGLEIVHTNGLLFLTDGNSRGGITGSGQGGYYAAVGYNYGWSSSATPTDYTSVDTMISRAAAGTISMDSATHGNAAATVKLTTLALQGVVVGSLPAAPSAGMIAYVTDASTSCSAGVAPIGGGSNKCFVGYNGTSWKEFGI